MDSSHYNVTHQTAAPLSYGFNNNVKRNNQLIKGQQQQHQHNQQVEQHKRPKQLQPDRLVGEPVLSGVGGGGGCGQLNQQPLRPKCTTVTTMSTLNHNSFGHSISSLFANLRIYSHGHHQNNNNHDQHNRDELKKKCFESHKPNGQHHSHHQHNPHSHCCDSEEYDEPGQMSNKDNNCIVHCGHGDVVLQDIIKSNKKIRDPVHSNGRSQKGLPKSKATNSVSTKCNESKNTTVHHAKVHSHLQLVETDLDDLTDHVYNPSSSSSLSSTQFNSTSESVHPSRSLTDARRPNLTPYLSSDVSGVVGMKNNSASRRRFSLKRKMKENTADLSYHCQYVKTGNDKLKEKKCDKNSSLKRSKTISAFKFFSFPSFSSSSSANTNSDSGGSLSGRLFRNKTHITKSNCEMNKVDLIEYNNNKTTMARGGGGGDDVLDGGFHNCHDDHKPHSSSRHSAHYSSKSETKSKKFFMPNIKKHKSSIAIRSIGSDGESEEYGSNHSDETPANVPQSHKTLRSSSSSISSLFASRLRKSVSVYDASSSYQYKQSHSKQPFSSSNELSHFATDVDHSAKGKLAHHKSSIGLQETNTVGLNKTSSIKPSKSFSILGAASKAVIRRRKNTKPDQVNQQGQSQDNAIDLISKRLSLPANLKIPPTFVAKVNKEIETKCVDDKSTSYLTQLITDVDKPLPRNLRRQSLVCQ